MSIIGFRHFLTTAAALLTFAAPLALAQHDPEPVDIGNWTVMAMSDTMCQAISGFDGVFLSIGQDKASEGRFVLASHSFTVEPGQTLPATWSMDGWRTTNSFQLDVVRLNNGAVMLHTPMDTRFGPAFGAAKRISVRVPGAKFDYEFDVPSAPELLEAIQTCNSQR